MRKFQGFFILLGGLCLAGWVHAAEYVQVGNKPSCAVWFAPMPSERLSWSGDCLDGYAAGRGILLIDTMRELRANSMFEGVFVKGKLEGLGESVGAGIFSYKGHFREGMREGFGQAAYRSANPELEANPETRARLENGKYIYEGVWQANKLLRTCPDPVSCGLEKRTVVDAPPARGRSISLN